MNARRQYLDELGKEYSRADEKNRGRLLDEAEKRTGLNRLVSDPGFEPPAGAEAAEAAKATGGIRSGGGDGVGRGMGCIRTAVRTAAGGGAGKRAGAAEETRGVALHGYGGRTTGGDFSEHHRSSAGTREASATFLRPNRNPNVQRLIYQKVPVKVAAEWAVSKKVPRDPYLSWPHWKRASGRPSTPTRPTTWCQVGIPKTRKHPTAHTALRARWVYSSPSHLASHISGKVPNFAMWAIASSKPPLPGRYSGRLARCQL